MRWAVVAAGLAWALPALGASAELRLTRPETVTVPPAHHYPYRSGLATDRVGQQIEVQMSLSDRETARAYGEQIARLGSDPKATAIQAAALILLLAVGSPDWNNAGVLVANSADGLAGVAALDVAMRRINRGVIVPRSGWFSFDGHIHTGRSHDGADSYEAVFAEAAARGLDAIAITDHNEFDYPRAKAVLDQMKAARAVPAHFVLVPGEEVSSADGHILAYFIRRRIEPGMSAAETIRAIHAQGGLAVAAHPSSSGGVGLQTVMRLPFDGIEIASGANVLPVAMASDWNYAIKARPSAFVLVNSDTHGAKGVGVIFTRLQADVLSLDGIRQAMEAGRTQPAIENQWVQQYVRFMQPIYSPLGSYLFWKERWLDWVAGQLRLDRVSVVTTWEQTILRMANLVFLPSEVWKLSIGQSSLRQSVALASVTLTKGSLRVSYELPDAEGVDRPHFRVEAKVDF